MNSINHNLMATDVAGNLNSHYGKLATSVERLSSGLRINSAADDAAGLAVREFMSADVATLHQGVRNANDAISMLQVADSALAIIDEKLIRMKELAEQAATGTYNSIQRLVIEREFQAMASEIDRIANATDFNGIKLLDGSLSGVHNGTGLTASGAMKIHFGTANDSAEDYYYIDINACGAKGLGLHNSDKTSTISAGEAWLLQDAVIDWDANKIFVNVPSRIAGPDNYNTPGVWPDDKHHASPQAISDMPGFDYYELPVGLENIVATSKSAASTATHKPHINLFTTNGIQITGVNPEKDWEPYHSNPGTKPTGAIWWNQSGDNTANPSLVSQKVINNLVQGGVLDASAVYNGNNVIYKTGESVSIANMKVSIVQGMNEIATSEEIIKIDKITESLVFMIGGHDTPSAQNSCNIYSLTIEADITPELKARLRGDTSAVSGHTSLINIDTQAKAQKALVRIDDAIVAKDKVRAHLGAMQNRLENTVNNLVIQGENLQIAESRISDADIASEMISFVRNQILTQSAVAMLGQANSYPHMLASLLNR